jgi:hypothetical protein
LTSAASKDPQAVCEAAVIAAFSAARAQGCSRYESFVRAVAAYREQCTDLPPNMAGPEVARILLATVQASDDADADLQAADGMEYVGPA